MPGRGTARIQGVGPTLIVLYGVLGVVTLLGQAIYRLTPVALEALGQLSQPQAAMLLGWTLFMLYSEGYRGFQKRFSPKVVKRALHLAAHPRPLFVLLAPAYCMAFFHATRRGLITAWGVTSMVVSLVILVRFVPQPWRGMIDGGVVLGLAWGVVTLLYNTWVGLRGGDITAPSELPNSSAQLTAS
ncbi:MAG: hypothetical protein KIT72_19915 [Polyangiaceae bacterium]|nr:hypothetical protein [Polyangiaceae bacterium]MCW5792689.1 hypothetical protein [Polyangiaceae bacterium]